jgi:hypothetical protein
MIICVDPCLNLRDSLSEGFIYLLLLLFLLKFINHSRRFNKEELAQRSIEQVQYVVPPRTRSPVSVASDSEHDQSQRYRDLESTRATFLTASSADSKIFPYGVISRQQDLITS